MTALKSFWKIAPLLAVLLLASELVLGSSNQALVYQGRVVRPDGTTPDSGRIDFNLTIYSPAPNRCALYTEKHTVDMTGAKGMFTLPLGLGTRLDSGAHSFKSVFVNGSVLTGLTCGSGTTYTSGANDDREIELSFSDKGTLVSLSAMPIKAVPFALQAMEINGWGLNNLVKVSNVGSPTTFTTDEMKRVKDISALDSCGTNEILKWDGFEWGCAADATGGSPSNAAYGSASKGVVAFDTDAATSGINVTSGVAKLSATGVSANTYGSATAVPAIAIDAQGRITSAAATTIALPVSQLTQSSASNGQVLKWNGSAWAPATDSGVTSDATYAAKGIVQFDTDAATSGVTVTSGIAKVNTGVGANQIVQLDGTGKLPAVDGSALTNITATGFSGVLAVANGGTNSNTALSSNRIMVSSGGKIVEAGAMTNGQFIIGSTGAAPAVATLGNSNGITLTPGAGSLSIGTNATDVNTASTIVSRDASGNFAAGAVTNTSNILKAGTGALTMTVPGTVTPYTLTWPAAVGGAGSFLTTDASGNLSWGSPAAISDSSYSTKGAVQFDTDAATSGVSVTSGVAKVNAGTGANQIVKLNGSSQLPAVDGSLLTNLSASNIASGVLPIARGGTNNGSLGVTAGGILYMDGTKAMTTAAGTSGQALISAGPGAPIFGTLSVGGGGTGQVSFAPNSLIMANGTGSQLTGMTCAPGQILKWNAGGTAWECSSDATGVAPGDAGYTSVNKGIVAFDTDAATSGVTVTSGVAKVNTGTGANQIVKLDGAGKLPAVDGSALTNVTAGAYSGLLPIANGGTNSGTALNNNRVMISSAGAIVEGVGFGATNTASTFVTRDASGNFAAGAVTNTSNILKATTGTLTMAVPGSVTDYTLTWPATVGGAGSFLTTDASGNLSWGSPAAMADASYAAKGVVQGLTNASTSGLIFNSGVISVNSGTGANQIVKLDASAKLPAVDGSALTNLSNSAVATAGAFMNGGNTFAATAALGTNSNHNLEVETNGTTKMTVTADGKIGIGTSTPGAKLEVLEGSIGVIADATYPSFIVTATSAEAFPAHLIFQSSMTGGADHMTQDELLGKIEWRTKDDDVGATVSAVASENQTNTAAGSRLTFSTTLSGSTTPLERMRIADDGMVGIGTNDPDSILHLNGALTIQGMAAPAVSPAGQGRIYYDSVANKFKISENGAAYKDLGGGVGGSGTANAIPKFTASGTVGDSGIVDDGTVITATRAIASTTNPIASGASVNLATSNTHTLASVGGTSIGLTGMQDGGVYNIVVEDTTSRTYTFSGCTNSYFKPANAATTAATRTVYGVMTVKKGSNWDCYVTWATGFQ